MIPALGLVKAVPLRAWLALGAAAALVAGVLYYGHTRYEAGQTAQRKEDATVIAGMAGTLDRIKVESDAAIARDAAAYASQAADMAEAQARLIQENADALASKDRTIADLRTGALRLRKQWQGCSASAGTEAGGGAEGGDDLADLRAEGTGDLIGNADLADAQVRYLQDLIRSADRCFKIED